MVVILSRPQCVGIMLSNVCLVYLVNQSTFLSTVGRSDFIVICVSWSVSKVTPIAWFLYLDKVSIHNPICYILCTSFQHSHNKPSSHDYKRVVNEINTEAQRGLLYYLWVYFIDPSIFLFRDWVGVGVFSSPASLGPSDPSPPSYNYWILAKSLWIMHLMTPLKPVEHNSNQIVYCMSMNSLYCEYHRFVVPKRLLRRALQYILNFYDSCIYVILINIKHESNYVNPGCQWIMFQTSLVCGPSICCKLRGFAQNIQESCIWWPYLAQSKFGSLGIKVSVDPSLTLSQWSSSGNPVCLELGPQCTLECHWRNASVLPVVFQWSSSGFPVVFQCVPIMQINTGSPLGHHWVLASASVVPVASQCTCGSSGFPVCSNYAN